MLLPKPQRDLAKHIWQKETLSDDEKKQQIKQSLNKQIELMTDQYLDQIGLTREHRIRHVDVDQNVIHCYLSEHELDTEYDIRSCNL